MPVGLADMPADEPVAVLVPAGLLTRLQIAGADVAEVLGE
jgi:hypothetical protein